ncbi:hypothetical protein JJB07_01440 [Tumebacillus sp. ITR2]|uniref:histidine kinase n=1 Tax=Tumebacillus amylolyticus TaxID=2801339 RepID=A0ABS1J4U5_9BACL|nr:ATP-binding protein [Tumebacillus amylolyticus]MBL0385296.1 hypothetical protein [Tumebacillus amylolyticus]
MSDIRDLILQMLIIIAPVLLYQILWRDRKPAGVKPNSWLIALLLSIALIKCMTFPVHMQAGMQFDLRWVPVVLAFWYGGPKIGGIVVAVLLAYRGYLGGDGLYMQLAILPFQVLPLLYMHRYMRSFRKISRTLVALSLGVWEAFCASAGFFISLHLQGAPIFTADQMDFFIGFLELCGISTGLASYLIENMIENGHMRREIQRAEKLHVLGQLAASIAHEVRNPITVTRGFMQLLGESELATKQQGYIKIAIDELDRAESIISDYLSFAKPQLEKLEVVHVNAQIRNLVNVLGSFAAFHSVELLTELGDETSIEADPAKLSQVLINITKNAIEATKNGGRIRLVTLRQKNHAVLHIIDEGIGMTEEQVLRLGNPYYSTKENGTGLGLMVSYRLIEVMNGTVDVHSKKGRGTQFTLTFPLVEAQ